ncbi:33172_t:CDS:2, partial [Racocetra persica]
LTTLNNKFEYVNNESDEQLDDKFGEQLRLYEVEEAYFVVESFACSNRFGIRKRRVEKDSNSVEISRSFICHHTGKPPNKNKLHKTERASLYHTDCK